MPEESRTHSTPYAARFQPTHKLWDWLALSAIERCMCVASLRALSRFATARSESLLVPLPRTVRVFVAMATSTVTSTRERSPSPVADSASALRTPPLATRGVQSTIIDGTCYDITNFMHTHPGQWDKGGTHARGQRRRGRERACREQWPAAHWRSVTQKWCQPLTTLCCRCRCLCDSGGAELLLLAVDRDSSILFHSYHRRLHVAKALLSTLPTLPMPQVASDMPSPVFGRKEVSPHPDLKPTPYTSTPLSHLESELYQEIRAGVNEMFKKQGIASGKEASSRGGMLVKSAVLVGLTCLFYYLVVVRGLWMLTPILGVFFAINGLAIQHDANHGSFSTNRWLNLAAGFLDDLIGGSGLMWRHQHVLAHHAYPNDLDWDADTFGNYPILRLNPGLEPKWWHKFQHIYILFLYSMIGLDYSFNDITNYLRGHYAHIRLHELRPLDHAMFILGKLAHFTIVLFVPLALYPWQRAIFGVYLPIELCGGWFLACVFAVSHNTPEAEYNLVKDPATAVGGAKAHTPCWAEMQIRTSCNWSPQSQLWLWASGGLNFQIEHHLFPGVAHKNYPMIHPIVKAACKKRGIPYNSYPTFWAIFTAHLAMIKKLGRADYFVPAPNAQNKKVQ